ncbi:MAG: YfhO family protein [Planctomycetes bacterium]|nr:YfhO family protein [Planctomycetota bacterium]
MIFKGSKLRRWLYILISSAVISLIAILLIQKSVTRLVFEIGIESSVSGISQLFYDKGRGFNEDDSARTYLSSGEWTRKYQFVLPDHNIQALRLDPIHIAGRVKLSHAQVIVPGFLFVPQKVIYNFPPESFKADQQIKSVLIEGETVAVETIEGANDPILTVATEGLQTSIKSWHKKRYLGMIYMQLFVLISFGLFVAWQIASLSFLRQIESLVEKIGQMRLINHKLIPILLLIVFCAIFFYPYLFDGKVVVSFQTCKDNSFFLQEKWLQETSVIPTFPCYDILTLFYPYKEEIRRSLSEGYIPLWNSHALGGMPFVANTLTGYFYPLNILLAVFSTPVAVTIISVINVLILACGIYFLLRVFGGKPVWSLIGAIAASQTAYIAHLFPMIPELGAVAWVPWMLAFMHLAVSKWNVRWLLGAIIATSLSILSGHIHYSYAAILLILVYTGTMVLLGLSEVKVTLLKRVFRWAIFIVLLFAGVGILTSPQLIPSWELTKHSIRGKVDLDAARTTAFSTEQVVQLWSRTILGAFDSVNPWGGYRDSNSGPPYIPLCVSGVILSAFLVNFFKRRYIPLTVAAIFFFGIAFGNKIVFEIAKLIPLFDHFQGPPRIGLYFTFIFVCFAAVFLSAEEKNSNENKVLRFIKTFPYLITIPVVLGIITVICWKYWKDVPMKHVISECVRIVVFLGIYQALYYLILRKKFTHLCIVAFVLVVSVESITANNTFNTKSEKPVSGNIRFVPEIEALGKDGGVQGRLVKVSNEAFEALFAPHNVNLVHNISYIQGLNAFIMKEITTFLDGGNINSLPAFLAGSGIRNFRPDELETPSLRLAGTRFVLSRIKLPEKYKILTNLGDSLVYELPDTLPLVYLLPQNISTESPHVELLKEAQRLQGHYTLNITKIPNGYEAEVKADFETTVVLGEIFYPGWRVWIDGEEKEVFKIGGGFIGGKLPQGSHKVRFEFRPQKFYTVLYIGGAFWLALVAYFIGAVFRYLRISCRK